MNSRRVTSIMKAPLRLAGSAVEVARLGRVGDELLAVHRHLGRLDLAKPLIDPLQDVPLPALHVADLAQKLRAFATQLAEALRTQGRNYVAAFLDDDPAFHRRRLLGVPVVGGTADLEATLQRLTPDAVLVTSLDLVELNPFLDDRGMTARLMVDLVGSLMGRKVFDRPTRSF